MKSAFVVQHLRKKDEDNEDVKMIGIFSNRENANIAIQKLKLQPGFRDHLDGFSIDEYELDKAEWSEGFGG